MAQQGGYRKPTNPAPVSGPGSLSQRTDGGPGQPIRDVPAANYGDRQEMHSIQGGATMAQDGMPSGSPVLPSNGPAQPSAPVTPMTPPTPLTDPTQRPDEPVTAGVNAGPGPGAPAQPLTADADIQKLLPYLPLIQERANSAESSQTLRNIVMYLKAYQ